MKIGNNGNLVLGPFDESTPCLMIVLMNCQTKLRINHLTAVKSVAILETRCRFVEWAQNEIAVVPDFHKRILFSDEAHFWLNGYVNKQNCRIWSEANPQVYVETPSHPEKLTVWCSLWAGGILLQKR
ncbi:alpha-2 adrenergic receptor [Trichonephila clavipes]|nr:alpha-2 adrenergic receptor [Trichonephila clavipes]